MELKTAYLADHPEALPILQSWFETEWAEWYGSGGHGDARADLTACAVKHTIPIGVIGFLDGELAGIAILKPESVSDRPALGPWAAGGLVRAPYRRRGVGAVLLTALEDVARGLGYPAIYCGTATSQTLLERAGWRYLEHARAHEDLVAVYRKAL